MRRFYIAVLTRAIGSLIFVASIVSIASPTAVYAQGGDSTTSSAPHYLRTLVVGAGTSILLHEAGHVVASLALGSSPSFGFNELRPTIYSNLNATEFPHKQFLFSAAGLTVQSLIDEGILDIPHTRGSAFERGMLAGGIGTTIFYLTIGRTGSVSDVDFMARTHAMTKTQITLIFGGIAALHTWRISRNPHYANFFVRPSVVAKGVDLGFELNR